MKMKKYLLITISIIFFLAIAIAFYQYHSFYKIPTQRLGLNDFYSDMPEDEHHKYINLPIDHNDPKSELFRDFYILSPNYNKNDQITFILTDGQMELVDLDPDFTFFNNLFGSTSYVLIGRRGHFPTLFPEVYNQDKTLNYTKAQNLYGSEQYIEDIELIRRDLEKNGLLRKEKINIFGASGAGVLAQQYISKYGQYVNKVILQSTGAPDLSKENNITYSPNFIDFNPEGNELLESIKQSKTNIPRLSNILYQIARSSKNPKQNQINILKNVKEGSSLFSYYFKPQYNLFFLKTILESPSSVASKVRYYELVGYDLKKYNENENRNVNLLYESSNELLFDFIEQEKNGAIVPKEFQINRSSFNGQILVLSGSEDVVFSTGIGEEIAKAYPNSKFIIFDENHKFNINNQESYITLRNDFLLYGFNSNELKNKEILQND